MDENIELGCPGNFIVRGDMVGYTGGTFDVLHAGHINFLRECKDFCDYLIVSLNTDDFIREYKREPLFNYEERAVMLLDTGLVDLVIPNIGGKDSKPAIQSVSPDIIMIGSDWLEKDYLKQMDFDEKWLRENNYCLMYLPYYEGISTSEIIKRCQKKL